MSEVIPISDDIEIPGQMGEPVPTCVKELERLLEAAKAGEIVGIAVGLQFRDGMGSYSIAGRVGAYSLLGAMLKAQHALLVVTDDDEDEA